MEIRIEARETQELLAAQSFSPDHAVAGVQELVLRPDFGAGGRGTVRSLLFDGVCVSHGCLELTRPVALGFEADEASVELRLSLQGTALARGEGLAGPLPLLAGHQQLTHAPHFRGEVSLTAGPYEFIELNLTPAFFQRLVDEHTPGLRDFVPHVTQQRPATLLPGGGAALTPALVAAARELVASPYAGVLGRLHLEAGVLHLLGLHLTQVGRAAAPAPRRSSTCTRPASCCCRQPRRPRSGHWPRPWA